MKTGTVLVATLFAMTSFPLLAQQTPPDNPANSPATNPATSPATQPSATPGSMPEQPPADNQPAAPAAPPAQPPGAAAAASPATPTDTQAAAVEMRPVHAQLVSKLDSKTAKTGDDVVVETKGSVKTADGTEIPTGSKLVGHVVSVQPSAGGTNAQVALQFDHAELKGGQKLPIQSQIQSIAPPEGAESASASEPGAGGNPSATPGATAGAAQGVAPGAAPAGAVAGSSEPTAGTVVSRNGNIAIRTTSIPGVLLANTEPGQQDPRMAQTSSILLGAKQDVQLEGGTVMVLAVATMPNGAPQ